MRIHIRGRSKTTPGQTLFVGLIFSLVGGVIMLFGLNQARQTLGFISTAAKAPGTVVRYATHGTGSKTTYYAVVQFTTQRGQVQEVTDAVGASQPRYQVGDRVEVLYAGQHPEQAQVNDLMSLWFLPLMASGLGGVAVVLGAVMAGTGASGWLQPAEDGANP